MIAANAWRAFEAKVDKSRPTHLTFRDAEKKAAHIIRKKPDVAKRARLIKGIEPDPAPPELSADAASAQLAEVLDDFFGQVGWTTTPTEALAIDVSQLRPTESPPPRLLLAGAAGLGKSRAVLKFIKRWNATLRAELGDDYIPTSVWFVGPTIKLCEELAAAYGDRAAVIRGRTHTTDKLGRGTLCDRPRDVEELTRAGITDVAAALCRTSIETSKGYVQVECPFFRTCGYYRQFEAAADSEVFFMSHQMMFVTISDRLLRRPDLLVIDETPLSSLLALHKPFGHKILSRDEIGVILMNELRLKNDPRVRLLQEGYTAKSIRAHAAKLEESTPKILPSMEMKAIRRALKKWTPTQLPRVLRKVADELNLKRGGLRCLSTGAMTVKIDGIPVFDEGYYLQYRRRIQRLRKDLPVLVLDATGDAELLAAAIPGLSSITIPAERNATVRQTYGFTASMGKVNGKNAGYRDEISAALANAATTRPNGLLVTYKEAEKGIALPEGWASEHFGNLRGIDKHKDKSAIVVLGRLQIAPKDAERMALALFYDDERPILTAGNYVKQPVGFRMRDGRRVGVETERHPCPVVDRIRWQHTEAEIIQAVDRLRLVHRTDRADVTLLNEVPTITVDMLRPYKHAVGRSGTRGGGGGAGSRLLSAYRRLNRTLPLRASWLARRFPDLWKNENAVKMELRDLAGRAMVIPHPAYQRI